MENGKWGQGQESSFPEPLLTVNREYPPRSEVAPAATHVMGRV